MVTCTTDYGGVFVHMSVYGLYCMVTCTTVYGGVFLSTGVCTVDYDGVLCPQECVRAMVGW